MKKFIKKHKYLCLFLLIVLFLIPYFLEYYPGIIISDTHAQLKQAMGISTLSNHHPVFQTFFWYIFIHIGNLFHSDNFIIALNSIFQILCTAGIFTYSIYTLDQFKIKSKLLTLIYLLYPLYGFYAIYTSKDSMFAISILFFLIEFIRLVSDFQEDKVNKKNVFLFIISCILVILYKGNGIHIIIMSVVFCLLFYKKHYKKILIMLFGLVLFLNIYNGILTKTFDMVKSKNCEKLSLFLMQMDYIVYHNKDQVDENVLNKIDKFIDVDVLKNTEITYKIDPIKKKFKEDYFVNHKLEFFLLSMELFVKYPKESVLSFLQKNARYVLPNGERPIFIHQNKPGNPLHINYKPVIDIPYVRYTYNKILKIDDASILIGMKNAPLETLKTVFLRPRMLLLSMFNYDDLIKLFFFNQAFILYYYIALFIYCFAKKKKDLLLFIPFIALWITSFLAPSTEYRYIYPAVFCLPFLSIYVLNKNKKE